MYDELIKRLRELHPEKFDNEWDFAFACQQIMHEAADAIKELLVASPPSLWTDEPISGTEFMTHNQGQNGFEIHFRTDDKAKYEAVQDECRRQIDHAKNAAEGGKQWLNI